MIDSYIDPPDLYDRYCDRQERDYLRGIDGMMCCHCSNCRKPGEEDNPNHIAWCTVIEEFISMYDTPGEIECWGFE